MCIRDSPGAIVKFTYTYRDTTDADGNYYFEQVLRNDYPVTCTVDDHVNFASTEDVTVDQDTITYNIGMIPFHYGVLSGTVTNSDDDAPVEGATVYLGTRNVQTAANGTFEIDAILYGDYPVLYCMAPDFDSFYITGGITVDAEVETQNFALHENIDNNDTPQLATPIYGPLEDALYSISSAEDIDWYVFYADSGIEFTMGTVRYGASLIDPEFFLYGPHEMDGSDLDLANHIATDDDDGVDVQPLLTYTTTESGFYFLRVAYYQNNPVESRADTGDYLLTISGEISFYMPPSNLTAEVNGFYVSLNWDAPAETNRQITRTRNRRTRSRAVSGYKVYRDNAVVAELPSTVTTYTDTVTSTGNHNYHVTAMHDGSTESGESNSVTIAIAPMNPPYGLNLAQTNGDVTVSWNISTLANRTQNKSRRAETTISRNLTGFKIYRDDVEVDELDDGSATSYIDLNVPEGIHSYYVTAIYMGEFESLPSNEEELYVVNGQGTETNVIPVVTSLEKNYPNPFNPVTSIDYSLHKNDRVKIVIFNAKGQIVKTLVNEEQAIGNYSVIWKGIDDNSHAVSSGIYFYKMQTSSYSKINKMILMK